MNKIPLERMSKAKLVASLETLNQRMEELETAQADYQRRFERLLEKDEVYRTLLDESSDPIFMFYPDSTYRYVNIAFADAVGKPQDQIIGRKIKDVFPPDEAEKPDTAGICG